jgi:trigger factor
MQVKEIKSPKLKKEYEISFSREELDQKLEEKLKSLGASLRVDGFRPGHVPLPVIRQRYGAKAREEMLSDLFQDTTDQLVKEHKLNLAGRPVFDILEQGEGEDLKIKIAFEILPEIKVAGLETLALTRYEVKVDEKKIAEALDGIAASSAESVPVQEKRKTKKGDIVLIDFLGKVNGKAFDGGAAEGYKLELGSNSFIPGFEDQLIGHPVNHSLVVKVTFPENYSNDLKGKAAEFDVTIHEIHEKKPSVIDDAFATKMGFKDLEDLKTFVKERLASEYEGMTHEYAKQDILTLLADTYTVDLPETMVENEYHGICHRLDAHDCGPGGHSPEFQKKCEDWRKEYYPIAERRVKLGLILAAISNAEGLRVTHKEIENEVMRQAYNMPGQEQKVVEYYKKNPQAVENLKAPILEEKVIRHILAKAKVTTKEVSLEKMSEMLKKREEEMENAYKE